MKSVKDSFCNIMSFLKMDWTVKTKKVLSEIPKHISTVEARLPSNEADK